MFILWQAGTAKEDCWVHTGRTSTWFVLLTLMKMTIKHFQIEYDAINRRNIFTNGDTINGRIILEAVKKTRIQSLVFKATGKASLRLVNYYGNIIDREDERDDHTHLEKIKYYRIKQDILKEGEQDGDV